MLVKILFDGVRKIAHPKNHCLHITQISKQQERRASKESRKPGRRKELDKFVENIQLSDEWYDRYFADMVSELSKLRLGKDQYYQQLELLYEQYLIR